MKYYLIGSRFYPEMFVSYLIMKRFMFDQSLKKNYQFNFPLQPSRKLILTNQLRTKERRVLLNIKKHGLDHSGQPYKPGLVIAYQKVNGKVNLILKTIISNY